MPTFTIIEKFEKTMSKDATVEEFTFKFKSHDYYFEFAFLNGTFDITAHDSTYSCIYRGNDTIEIREKDVIFTYGSFKYIISYDDLLTHVMLGD